MANRKINTARTRVQARTNQAYVYGNVAPDRKIYPGPGERPHRQPEERPAEEQRQRSKSHRQSRQNARREAQMNAGYVIFLALASIAALIVCVGYIRVQSQVTDSTKKIAGMQSELSEMKEENNAKESTAQDAMNLEEVRDKAVNELGMVYASPEQIVSYSNPSADYVKQLEDIPEQGVLAKSGSNQN